MFTRLTVILVSFVLLACLPCAAQDADGDGMPDAQEAVLGTAPGLAEALQVVIADGPESAEGSGAKETAETAHLGQEIRPGASGGGDVTIVAIMNLDRLQVHR